MTQANGHDPIRAIEETMIAASDPALAADVGGLDWAALDGDLRDLLRKWHREVVEAAIAGIAGEAAAGDSAARSWLKRQRLSSALPAARAAATP